MDVSRERFQEWLSNKGLSTRTLENYLYYFDNFTFGDFTQENISIFLSNKKTSNVVARSFAKNLKRFLIENYVELNISESMKLQIAGVELPKITGRKKVRVPIPIPYHLIPVLGSKLKTGKEKLQLALSYNSALRCQEMMRIRPIDFNWDVWKLDQEKAGECIVQGKGNKREPAIIPSVVMRQAAAYIRKENVPVEKYIFFIGNTKGSLQSRSRLWRRRLSEAGVMSGITKKTTEGEVIEETRVHPHRLRHSFATHCLDRGISLAKIQKLLRHSSIQSTQIYLHVSQDKLKEDVEEMSRA